MFKKIVVINGNNFHNIEGFYLELDRVLKKNPIFSTNHNLDALRDLFRGGFGAYDYGEDVIIVWENSEKSRGDLGYYETIEHYENLLTKSLPSNRNKINSYLDNARRGKGDTLFNIINKIIKDQGNVDLLLK